MIYIMGTTFCPQKEGGSPQCDRFMSPQLYYIRAHTRAHTHTYWDPLSDLLRKLRIWLLAVMWWTIDVGVGELNALISWFDVTVYVKHRVQRPAYVWITKRNVLNRTTKCILKKKKKKKGLKFLQLPAKHEEVCLVFSILSPEPFEHYETRTMEGTHPPQYYVVLYVDV